MSQDVTYNIKGTSDVPQQTEKAKKAMSAMDRQAAAIGKKFSEAGKDLFLSFLAPVALIHTAISFIGDAISKARQDAKDAVDFAAGVKLEDLNKSPVDVTTRFMAQKLKVDIRTEEEQKNAERARREVVREFLIRDPRGQEYYRKNAPMDDSTGGPGVSERILAGYKSVQEDIMKMNEEDMKKAISAEQQKAQEEKNKKEPSLFTGDNSTFGVGLSPQMNLLNQQVELQKQANEYLAIIANATNTPTDFTKDTSNGNASKNVYYETTNVS